MAFAPRSPVYEVEGAGRGVSVKVAADGRILVPAHLRRAAGIEPGATVSIRLRDGQLLLEDERAALRRLQALLAPLWVPGESVVDELIADRRAEAERE